MDVEWDPREAEQNVRKHGVAFEDAVTIFADPHELMISDPDHSLKEDRFVSTGLSRSGRVLVVGYTERGSNIRIIFARREAAPVSIES